MIFKEKKIKRKKRKKWIASDWRSDEEKLKILYVTRYRKILSPGFFKKYWITDGKIENWNYIVPRQSEKEGLFLIKILPVEEWKKTLWEDGMECIIKMENSISEQVVQVVILDR